MEMDAETTRSLNEDLKPNPRRDEESTLEHFIIVIFVSLFLIGVVVPYFCVFGDDEKPDPPSPFSGVKGTADNPYQLTESSELTFMKFHLTSAFILMKDTIWEERWILRMALILKGLEEF